MNKKTIGMLVCTLLIAATVLPVVGISNDYKTTNVEESIIETEQQGMLSDDFDWQRSGNNIYTGHGGSYPSGNVGIGTTSPNVRLHIKANTPMVKFEESDQGNKQWHFGGYDAGFVISETGVYDRLYIKEGGNVGIGTTDPSAKLDVETVLGGGGAATIGDASNVATGDHSIAMGFQTTATEWCATALGYITTASGDSSTAMGVISEASDYGATAIGFKAKARGQASVALGNEVEANGDYSTAMGDRMIVNGYNSFGIGLGFQYWEVVDDHVMAIMGGNVGIGERSPMHALHVYSDDDIAAAFEGRVKGEDAINNDEFVTKGQVKSVVTTNFTPTGTSDNNGEVGDTAWDDNYFYVKTPNGWKRAELETWESTPMQTHTTLNTK